MYKVDNHDRVIELDDLPQSSVGAPIPTIIQSEFFTYVAYYCQRFDPDWDGTSVRVVGPTSQGETTALVRFRTYATYFGAPNDEAFSGHPLYSRGLKPYGFFEIERSSWIRSLEQMNSVHPRHDAAQFLERYRHFVLSFHDTTLECVASGFSLVETRDCSVTEAVQAALRLVEGDS